MNRNQIKLI